MEIYILKSATCLAILFVFHKLILENTALHTTKRVFLLSSLVGSFLIPFITFTEAVVIAPVVTTFTEAFVMPTTEQLVIIEQPINYTPYILWSLYAAGVLFFGFRFVRNLFSLVQKIRKNPVFREQSFLYVLLQLPVTPHSFFNYIFFDKTAYEAGNIPKEVLIHEQAHVTQKHSWDILFFELLQIVFWFNPLLYFFKKSIKLNHEFLADRTVLQQGASLTHYQSILLDFSSKSSVPAMAHSINYSSIKKRFNVMKTHTSRRAAWLKGLLILPLLAVLVYGFSETKQEFITSEIATETPIEDKILSLDISEANEIFNGNAKVMIADLQNLVEEDGYSKTALSVDSGIDVSFAKSVVAELVRLDIASNMTICNSANSHGILSTDKISEIMSPLMDRYKNKNETKAEVFTISENIDIEVRKDKSIYVNNKLATFKTLPSVLSTFNAHLTKEQRADIVVASIKSNESIPMGFIFDLKQILVDYGISRIKIPGEIYRDEGENTIIKDAVLDFNTKNYYSVEEASLSELSLYNRIAKKYNLKNIEERVITPEELILIKTVYKKMSLKQKEKNAPMPEFLPNNIPNTGKDYYQNLVDGKNKKNTYANEKALTILISKSSIIINDKKVGIKNFANTLDALTMYWTPSECSNANISVTLKNVNEFFKEKIEFEYKQTMLYQYKRNSLIPPPPPTPKKIKIGEESVIPPPPTSKWVKKGEASNIPPPPPPPSNMGAVKKKYEYSYVLYVNGESIYLDGKKVALSNFAKAMDTHTKDWPASAYKLYGVSTKRENVSEEFIKKLNVEYQKTKLAKTSSRKQPYIFAPASLNLPPPPPPGPEKPLDHVIAMAKRNASFYYEMIDITSDKAIEMVKNNPNLKIQTRLNDPKPPMVYISEVVKKINFQHYNIPSDTSSLFKQEQEKLKNSGYLYNVKSKFNNHQANDNFIIKTKSGNKTVKIYDFPDDAKDASIALKVISNFEERNPKFSFEGKSITASEAKNIIKKNTTYNISVTEYAANFSKRVDIEILPE